MPVATLRMRWLLACAQLALAGCSLINDFDVYGEADAAAGDGGDELLVDAGLIDGGDDTRPREDAGDGARDDAGKGKGDGGGVGKDGGDADAGDAGDGGDACVSDCDAPDACDPNPCGALMTCSPRTKAPGFTCTCEDGYALEDGACKNVDECFENTHTCHPSATCVDTEGGFDCTCAPGFAGGGTSGIACTPRVGAGVSHTCAVRSNGRVACWGDNSVGQVGDGTNITRTAPKAVVGLSKVASIASGLIATTCAVLADGTVECWGMTIGGASSDFTMQPVAIEGLTDVIAVAVGYTTACAALRDGRVRCWGANNVGQLGDGTMSAEPRAVPGAAVSGVTDAIGISVGAEHACALLRDGHATCWGGNQWGQLGTGTTDAIDTPVMVVGLSDAVYLASAERHTCALLGDRRVICWGLNSPDRLVVTGLSNAVSISAGEYDTCAVLQNGTIKCWLTPPDVSGTNGYAIDTTTAVSIGMGGDNWHACAVLQDGTVACAGNNASGQLGDDTTTSPAATSVGRGVTLALGLDLF